MIEAIQFKLNGEAVGLRVDGERMLLWVLRTDLGLSKGVCTFKGCCTNRAAAKAFDLKVEDIQQLLKSPAAQNR